MSYRYPDEPTLEELAARMPDTGRSDWTVEPFMVSDGALATYTLADGRTITIAASSTALVRNMAQVLQPFLDGLDSRGVTP